MNPGLVCGQSELGAASREATLRCYTDASCARVVLRNTRITGPALAEDATTGRPTNAGWPLAKAVASADIVLAIERNCSSGDLEPVPEDQPDRRATHERYQAVPRA